jgi:UDP-N-acetylmuramate-alanine ligase
MDVRYVARREDLVAALASELRDGDLCLTMGAGDLTAVPDQLRVRLEVG